MTAPPLLAARGVTLRRDGTLLLDAVDLDVADGEIVTIVGPNGAGKTTLLRVLMGLDRADAGSVERRPGLRVGYVPQRLHVDPILPLTVRGFLGLSGNRDPQAARTALDRVGIADRAEAQVSRLSGGELQRAVLARALLRRPHLLLLDEPTQGVDVGGMAELYRLIGDIRRDQRCGVLMVSHDLHVVMGATDTVVCLNRHVCCTGHPHDVSRDPRYQSLFGREVAGQLAVYTHHHDHAHGPDGRCVPPPPPR
ncbi:ATP-binding cassette domain-containing protein [Novispirillum sp. DQ9]|uniref:ATP-binding cassette domain-containing protein n=1 Tax=Novispirillum sp. DQ9 TaxID=3398612 RepID=UPI003C7BAF88